MAWTTRDTALTIGGVGSLASAWGQYKTDKERNRLINKQMAYDKERNDKADAKLNQAQDNLDDAFSDSDFNVKKKKKKIGDVTVDDTTTVV